MLLLVLSVGSLEPKLSTRDTVRSPVLALSKLFKADTRQAPTELWGQITRASTWDPAHTVVYAASDRALFRADEQGDVVGSETIERVAGARNLAEEASGDAASGSGSGEGSGSGSGEGSGEAPGYPPPAPPPSPLAPGSSSGFVNKTIITMVIVIAGEVADFDDALQATFKTGLRNELCPGPADATGVRCPGVEIALTIAAASVSVTAEISYREDDSSIANASAVQARAESLASTGIAALSAALGVTVETAPTVTVAKNVLVLVTFAAPTPPPSTPPLPTAPPPSLPPSSSSDDGFRLETWMIAVIAAGGGLVLLGLGLAVYKYTQRKQKKKAAADYGAEMGKRGDFPLAIGPNTTQHV